MQSRYPRPTLPRPNWDYLESGPALNRFRHPVNLSGVGYGIPVKGSDQNPDESYGAEVGTFLAI